MKKVFIKVPLFLFKVICWYLSDPVSCNRHLMIIDLLTVVGLYFVGHVRWANKVYFYHILINIVL